MLEFISHASMCAAMIIGIIWVAVDMASAIKRYVLNGGDVDED